MPHQLGWTIIRQHRIESFPVEVVKADAVAIALKGVDGCNSYGMVEASLAGVSEDK